MHKYKQAVCTIVGNDLCSIIIVLIGRVGEIVHARACSCYFVHEEEN